MLTIKWCELQAMISWRRTDHVFLSQCRIAILLFNIVNSDGFSIFYVFDATTMSATNEVPFVIICWVIQNFFQMKTYRFRFNFLVERFHWPNKRWMIVDHETVMVRVFFDLKVPNLVISRARKQLPKWQFYSSDKYLSISWASIVEDLYFLEDFYAHSMIFECNGASCSNILWDLINQKRGFEFKDERVSSKS